jgi:hypothetical protein
VPEYTHVIFHGGCPDGFGAALAAAGFTEELSPQAGVFKGAIP